MPLRFQVCQLITSQEICGGLIGHTGAAAAWVDTVEKFGSGKLSVADVLAPAIRLAEEGYAKIMLLLFYALTSCRVPVSEIHSYAVGLVYQ